MIACYYDLHARTQGCRLDGCWWTWPFRFLGGMVDPAWVRANAVKGAAL